MPPAATSSLTISGTIIYVGKAKDLKKRVTSYFQKKDHDPKTRNLVAAIASMDVMVTNTETEALLLENNLIKKHQPKYNIDLKDAKRFAYIELTREPFPRIGIARRTRKEDAVYFGPFVSAAKPGRCHPGHQADLSLTLLQETHETCLSPPSHADLQCSLCRGDQRRRLPDSRLRKPRRS